jgi:transketolase
MTESFQTDEHSLGSRIRSLGVIANRLRRHSIRMTSAAGSGHPTSCLSAADLVAAIFFDVLRYDVRNPDHPDNDRFVLSKGHAAPLLYAAWAEAGAIPTDFLGSLRRIDSELEGHPTPRFPWVEVGTGSLGQGLSVGLGMAHSMKLENREARVFVLLGDGEVMEGSVWEAVELAPRLGVDNLLAIVDVNRLGQSDPTSLEWDLLAYARRFEAFGWNPLLVEGA